MKNPLAREDFSIEFDGTCPHTFFQKVWGLAFLNQVCYTICVGVRLFSHLIVTMYVPQKAPSGAFCFWAY
jgi:hypothetical protein